jgi:hypothetical protein
MNEKNITAGKVNICDWLVAALPLLYFVDGVAE